MANNRLKEGAEAWTRLEEARRVARELADAAEEVRSRMLGEQTAQNYLEHTYWGADILTICEVNANY